MIPTRGGGFARVSDAVRRYGGTARVLRFARERPAAAARAAARLWFHDWRRALLSDPAAGQVFAAELDGLLEDLERRLAAAFLDVAGSTARGNPFIPGQMHRSHVEALYALVRDRRPAVVVETGVCNGFSTAVLLAALAKNGHGELVSVDLPEFASRDQDASVFWAGKRGAVVPAGRAPGWLVPRALEGRWTLEIGASRTVLPRVLRRSATLDMFVHDSEHSYDNQIFEFRAAFRALACGGLLVATDLGSNRAFTDFWSEVRRGARRTFVDHSVAVVVKGRR